MIQLTLVLLLFSIALFYMGRKLYREYQGRGGHCEDCAVSELDNSAKG